MMNQKLLIAIFIVLSSLCLISYMPPATNWNAKQIDKLNAQGIEGDFCFAVISDVHNNLPAFTKFLSSLYSETRFIVVNGDFIHHGFNEEYHLAVHMFKKTELPIFAVIGNHEIEFGGRAVFLRTFGSTYYSFNVSDTQFIFLDNSMYSIDVEQYDWLKEKLDENFENRLIFMHIPTAHPYNNSLDTDDRKLLENVLNKSNINLIISSHWHKNHEFTSNGLHYSLTGSGGGETNETFSYSKVCLIEGETYVETISFAEQAYMTQMFNIGFILAFVVVYKSILIIILAYMAVNYISKEKPKKMKRKKSKNKR